MIRPIEALSLIVSLLAAAPAAHAASACQPLFDAYAAQKKVPALKKIVATPGMADAVELILTQDALYSRVGVNDSWSKTVIDDAVRSIMAQGYPTAETIEDCRLVGPQEADGIAGTAYEFAPPKLSGNAPGEMLTVLIDDGTGLPVSETALKAGTRVTIVYDGVTAPVP